MFYVVRYTLPKALPWIGFYGLCTIAQYRARANPLFFVRSGSDGDEGGGDYDGTDDGDGEEGCDTELARRFKYMGRVGGLAKFLGIVLFLTPFHQIWRMASIFTKRLLRVRPQPKRPSSVQK